MSRAWAIGGALIAAYTGLIAGADAITKLIAGAYQAPQLYALSGLVVMALALLADRHPRQRQGLGTGFPAAMALRSGATVLAAVAFFQAFANLPFAEVFLFIALMPLLAALLSGPILGEPVRLAAWGALGAGFIGMLCLFPAGISDVGAGHVWALIAAGSGTFSMVLARYIGRHETNALAQVFYPNMAIFVTMALALPFVWQPMALGDLLWVLAYAVLLFGARWVSVEALRRLPAYVATPLMNVQFVWMVLLGALFFGEIPDGGIWLGAAIVIGSGLFLIWDQALPARASLMSLFGGSAPALRAPPE